MFSYKEFIAKIKSDGLARQNRFFITIALPKFAADKAAKYNGNGLRDIHLLCKSVNVPGVNVSTNPIRMTGEQFEVPYDRTFSAATFTFYVDRAMIVREFFDDWVTTVQDHQTRTIGWFDDFISPYIVITLQDKMSKSTYMMILYEAIIKSVSNLSLDQGANDPMTLDVSIDYHYYATWNLNSPVGSVQGGNGNNTNEIVANIGDNAPSLYNPMQDFAEFATTSGFYEDYYQFQDQYSQELVTLYDANQQLQSALPTINNSVNGTAITYVG